MKIKKIVNNIINIRNEFDEDVYGLPHNINKVFTFCGLKIKLNISMKNYFKRSIKQWYIKEEHQEKNQIYPRRPSIYRLFFNYIFSKCPTLVFCHHMVTTFCTLKCKDCCCFIPYYDKTSHLKPISFEQFKQELDLLLKEVASVEIYSFMGGEPLLVKDLPQMIEYAAKQKKIKFIYITTNGTIVPSDDLLREIKKFSNKIKISISNYNSNPALSEKLHYEELFSVLKKYNIKYEYFKEAHWYTNIEFVNQNNDFEVAYNNFSNCYMKHCITYMGGKLYLCPLVAYLERNHKISEEQAVVDFNNGLKNREKLIRFLEKSYFEVCGHCNHNNVKETIVAEQINGKV